MTGVEIQLKFWDNWTRKDKLTITEALHSNVRGNFLTKNMNSWVCPLKYAEEMQKKKLYQYFHLEKEDSRKSNRHFSRGLETIKTILKTMMRKIEKMMLLLSFHSVRKFLLWLLLIRKLKQRKKLMKNFKVYLRSVRNRSMKKRRPKHFHLLTPINKIQITKIVWTCLSLAMLTENLLKFFLKLTVIILLNFLPSAKPKSMKIRMKRILKVVILSRGSFVLWPSRNPKDQNR